MRPETKPALRRGPVAALAVFVVVGACFFAGPADRGIRFSHSVHNDEKGLTCRMCHSSALTGAAAGMPGRHLCTPCHDEKDEEELARDQQVLALFDEFGRYLRRPVADIPDEVRFSHEKHFRHRVECADCHGDVATSDVIPMASSVDMQECIDCHGERGKDTGCATCHQAIDVNWAPPSHARSWESAHGHAARWPGEVTSNDCSMCHREAGCKGCHQQAVPRDHNHFWRLRGHGVAVAVDRSRCATCHQSDDCVRCHQSTEPLSHRAGWGSPQERHCTGCHLPLSTMGCRTCHQGTPSHFTAVPPPANHHPAMNCRLCHGNGAPLPHPDNGTSCATCHRF